MILLRPVCWILGHKKTNQCVNVRKNIALGHLCGDAGTDFDCARCGYLWRDSEIPIDATFGWDEVSRD